MLCWHLEVSSQCGVSIKDLKLSANSADKIPSAFLQTYPNKMVLLISTSVGDSWGKEGH